MSGVRGDKPSASLRVAVEHLSNIAIVDIAGPLDEQFEGVQLPAGIRAAAINVAGMTRMTSFGVRQWLRMIEGLSRSLGEIYLLGCPTFLVDQLNMVLNFGGTAQVLTVIGPYSCMSCGIESGELIDVLAGRSVLPKGGGLDRDCSRCGGKLELDETPESYFSFVAKYAATGIDPEIAAALAQRGLYTTVTGTGDKPPKIIKLVHGAVTYFRLRGRIGSMFRARPLLVGAEGEVVIDLAEIEDLDPGGVGEWTRMLKTLASMVPAVTLIDVPMSYLAKALDTLAVSPKIAIWSIRAPYTCKDCGRSSLESYEITRSARPSRHVCSTCGGESHVRVSSQTLAPLIAASAGVPTASAKLVKQRAEVLSRALTDANVAQAKDAASASLSADDTVLGKYKIVQRLTAGGMAEVFLAKQIGIGGFEKLVALKRIQRQLLENRHLAIGMFLNEAKIAGRLMHPNIVQVLDVGEVGGALYLAMEYVHGKDLRYITKHLAASRQLLPPGLVCFVIREVAQALHHAYWSTDMTGQRLSVVHRDVSPHNIIIGYDGSVKLLDFGVAISAVTESSQSMVVGKWQYMSPEHATNQYDHRSDLFSLGVVAYLLATGRMPFDGDTPKELIRRIRAGDCSPVADIAPGLPPALATLIDRMLLPDADQRPQRGQEVVLAIAEVVRSNALRTSAEELATFLSELLEESASMPQFVGDRVRVTGSLANVKLGAGSGATGRNDLEDSRSRSLSPSQPSARTTPSSFSAASIDQSISLPRGFAAVRRVDEQAAPTPPQPARLPRAPAPRRGWLLLILGLVLAAGIGGALYVVL